jgi:hypothetical protein
VDPQSFPSVQVDADYSISLASRSQGAYYLTEILRNDAQRGNYALPGVSYNIILSYFSDPICNSYGGEGKETVRHCIGTAASQIWACCGADPRRYHSSSHIAPANEVVYCVGFLHSRHSRIGDTAEYSLFPVEEYSDGFEAQSEEWQHWRGGCGCPRDSQRIHCLILGDLAGVANFVSTPATRGRVGISGSFMRCRIRPTGSQPLENLQPGCEVGFSF